MSIAVKENRGDSQLRMLYAQALFQTGDVDEWTAATGDGRHPAAVG